MTIQPFVGVHTYGTDAVPTSPHTRVYARLRRAGQPSGTELLSRQAHPRTSCHGNGRHVAWDSGSKDGHYKQPTRTQTGIRRYAQASKPRFVQ